MGQHQYAMSMNSLPTWIEIPNPCLLKQNHRPRRLVSHPTSSGLVAMKVGRIGTYKMCLHMVELYHRNTSFANAYYAAPISARCLAMPLPLMIGKSCVPFGMPKSDRS